LRNEVESSKTPIIMFTAKSQIEDKVAGYDVGVDDYLTKPVHPAELVAHIKGLLARGRGRSAGANQGYVIGVMGAKGGLGVSTMALNLAIIYQQKSKDEVIAAEIRPGQGSWGLELGINETDGLSNLLKLRSGDINPSKIDSELVLTRFGIKMLLASNRSKDCALLANTDQLWQK
jgi:Flp pilus assembly CpaE family ATPase